MTLLPLRAIRNQRVLRSRPPRHLQTPATSSICLAMRINAQNSGDEGKGIVLGGYHLPDVTQIFRHHPSRPAPQKSAGGGVVPTIPAAGYLKYLAAGGFCATITHVLFLSSSSE